MAEYTSLKHLDSYAIWVSEPTNYKNNALGLRGAEKLIEEALPRFSLANKHARLYILRHSRATHLAKHLTEAQMCVFFGWIVGTKWYDGIFIYREEMWTMHLLHQMKVEK